MSITGNNMAGLDCNNFISDGRYQCQGEVLNSPPWHPGTGYGHFFVDVYHHADSWIVQVAHAVDHIGSFIRHCIGGTWKKWEKIATSTPPQEYDLPLADGWQAIIPSLYAKNQFSEVTINARLKFTGNFERGTVFATLPEGYRPNKQATVFARVVNSQNQSNFGHIDITQDGEMFLYADGAAGAPLNEVFMPSISFIAGS